MRLTSFFLISLALHSVALVQPLSFYGWRQEPPIAVTILPIESGGVASGSASDRKSPPSNSRGTAVKTIITAAPIAAAPEVSESLPLPSPVEVIAKASETNVVLAVSTAIAESAFTAGGGSGAAGIGGNGFASVGTGSGFGNGQDSSPSAALLTQARYHETPKPVYPDAARRDGREGQVLLRVLIDDQGKTKSVEINRSSGSDALDHAATEAIKRWRFHPARAGDKPVASWVSIPIEFQLKDLRN
jgi:periplasmic protein TonB